MTRFAQPMPARRAGAREGPRRGRRRIVLVHGTRDCSQSFGPIIQRVSDFDVETYDRSGWAPDEMISVAPKPVQEHADDLLEVLHEEPAVVVGHSWGGHVVLAAAIRRPDLFEAIGVWETVMAWAPWWPSGYGDFMVAAARTAAARTFTSEHERYERDRYAAEIEDVLHRPYDLDQLEVPCLVGYGTDTFAAIVVGASGFAESVGAELFVLEGAEHMAHRNDPAGFESFIRRTVEIADGPRRGSRSPA